MIDPALISYTEFIPHVQSDVPGCPREVIKDAIRKTCIDFCQRSNYWRHELETMDLIKDEPDYEFEPFRDTFVTSIRSMVTDDGHVHPRTEEELDDEDHNWRDLTNTRPSFYIAFFPGEFRLVPFPTETVVGVLKILVALAPTRASTEVWEDIFTHHLTTIQYGAQSRLLDISKKQWTDHALARVRDAMYRRKVSGAIIDAKKSYSNRTLRAKAREFGF